MKLNLRILLFTTIPSALIGCTFGFYLFQYLLFPTQLYFVNKSVVQTYTVECFTDDACRAAVWATSKGIENHQFNEKISVVESDSLPFFIPEQDTSIWINSNIIAYHNGLHKFYTNKFVATKTSECFVIAKCKSAYKNAHGLMQLQAVLNKYVALPDNYITIQYIQPLQK